MLKTSNKMSYLAAISILSVLVVGAVPVGIMMVAHASNDRNNDDPRNQACYNAGFADGQKNKSPFSQSAFNQCGPNGRAYYEGFISGCISGHGKDFFSCQRLTGLPINGVGVGSGSGSGSGGNNTNGGSRGGSGFGGFNSFGGGGGGGGGQ
jgi:hypothetical protein